MKLVMVCLTLNFDFRCLKCRKTMPITETHYKGMFHPEKPLAPGSGDSAYVYALCVECFDEIKDEKTGYPCDTWQAIFEDEITEIVTLQKHPRVNVEDTGLSEKEISALQTFIMTGRVSSAEWLL